MIAPPLALLALAGCDYHPATLPDDSSADSVATDSTDSATEDSEDLNCVYRFWYLDRDGDGWGYQDPAHEPTSVWSCEPVAGYSTEPSDCDDTSSATFPGAIDAAGDGIDTDCDGVDG